MADRKNERKRKASSAAPKSTILKHKKTEIDEIPVKSKYFSNSKEHQDSEINSGTIDPEHIGPVSNVKIDKKDFFDKPCLDLSKELLGKLLVRKLKSGERVSGFIVETEAYTGKGDVASHSYKGKTERNTAMFMDPGTAYVYHIYGTYCCMNISSRGDGAAVLLRALMPQEGEDSMRTRRNIKAKAGTKAKSTPLKDLCNGPSKFCMALDITKSDINKEDMTNSDSIWLEEGMVIPDSKVVTSRRIGIDGAGQEAASKPWRFYVLGNMHVSKRDKEAEKGK